MNEPVAVLIHLIRSDSILGPAFAGRVRTGSAEQVDRRPYCLVWSVTNAPADESIGGEVGVDVGTVQVDVYADSFRGELGANRLAARIRDVMAANSRGKFANVFVASMMRSGGPHQFEERLGKGADEIIARVTIDYRVHYHTVQVDE